MPRDDASAKNYDGRVLVVGAGQAGLQAAVSVREAAPNAHVTLLGGEGVLPYQRPPLSKSYLLGKSSRDDLYLRGEQFFAAERIALAVSEWVSGIELSKSSGDGVAWTERGSSYSFDRLVLAVGGSPRRLSVPGADLDGVHYLRDLQDAQRLKQDLAGSADVVVVGGGYIGLEVAAAATAQGKRVWVVEQQDRLLARTVAPAVSAFFAEAHRRRGVELVLGAEVAAVAGESRVRGIELADGRFLPADVVVVGIGLEPQLQLAEHLGLRCDHGIVVDQRARTSVPGVLAAGDCTVAHVDGVGLVRQESVQNAIGQGRQAAATAVGADAAPAHLPWFWSDQGDLKLQTAGLNAGWDQVIVRHSAAEDRMTAFYYRCGRLCAVDAVNTPRDFMAARRLLEAGRSIDPDYAADVTAPLRDLLRTPVS